MIDKHYICLFDKNKWHHIKYLIGDKASEIDFNKLIQWHFIRKGVQMASFISTGKITFSSGMLTWAKQKCLWILFIGFVIY